MDTSFILELFKDHPVLGGVAIAIIGSIITAAVGYIQKKVASRQKTIWMSTKKWTWLYKWVFRYNISVIPGKAEETLKQAFFAYATDWAIGRIAAFGDYDPRKILAILPTCKWDSDEKKLKYLKSKP